ncbi:MAG: ribonuclease HII [Proteobacteria bacterium]|nr:ribonuclease HII [Pseudomonadota bacterium]MBS0465526.1 ribonuclease HII [Pseudomonadota bacterium]
MKLPPIAGRLIAGVDEAGRGPLAGPVVVAAVILDPKRRIHGLGDSKALSPARREQLAPIIGSKSLAHAVIEIDAAMIDRINIFQATMDGMRRALAALEIEPELALIDGNRLPAHLRCPAQAIVRGDARVRAIGAASILAKVHRDRVMHALDAQYPGYGFAVHKGYPTPEHLAALRDLGPCAIHRRSFAPVLAATYANTEFDF